ncbi:MAG: hypothetical protein FJZ90_02080 [Chloroflexi bacterium]|nr:hypothetical protein [Chloroflexota bacterium]
MPTGTEHVQAVSGLCQTITERLETLADADGAWKAEAIARLQAMRGTLDGMGDRFFLKSKLCMPFAARCVREAEGLQGVLKQLEAGADDQARQRFAEALNLLEKAVQTLDERSTMQGMAIT